MKWVRYWNNYWFSCKIRWFLLNWVIMFKNYAIMNRVYDNPTILKSYSMSAKSGILVRSWKIGRELVRVGLLMGKVVYVVGNIIWDGRVNNWGLWQPKNNLQVPHLESFEELSPVFLCPVRDIKAYGYNVAEVARVKACVDYHCVFLGILVNNVRLDYLLLQWFWIAIIIRGRYLVGYWEALWFGMLVHGLHNWPQIVKDVVIVLQVVGALQTHIIRSLSHRGWACTVVELSRWEGSEGTYYSQDERSFFQHLLLF